MTGIAFVVAPLFGLASTVAAQNERIAVMGGWENEHAGPRTSSSNTNVGGPRIGVRSNGLNAARLFRLPSELGLRFAPLWIALDPTVDLSAPGVAPAPGASTGTAVFRAVTAGLAEATLWRERHLFSLRANAGLLEYDRDRGFLNWRALQAEGVVHHRLRVRGDTAFDIEASAGFSIGGVSVRSLGDLETALSIANPMSHYWTLDAVARARAGIGSDRWDLSLGVRFDHRFDLEANRPVFEGVTLTVDSDRLRTDLRFRVLFSRYVGATLEGGFDFDNLTLVGMFHPSQDAFFLSIYGYAGVLVAFGR